MDIHLSAKIVLDWMSRGQRKEVGTPGQNEKRYLAGAMSANTDRLTVVKGERNTGGQPEPQLQGMAAELMRNVRRLAQKRSVRRSLRVRQTAA